jgi:hypothetical protein
MKKQKEVFVGYDYWWDQTDIRCVFETEAAAKRWARHPLPGRSRSYAIVPFVRRKKKKKNKTKPFRGVVHEAKP